MKGIVADTRFLPQGVVALRIYTYNILEIRGCHTNATPFRIHNMTGTLSSGSFLECIISIACPDSRHRLGGQILKNIKGKIYHVSKRDVKAIDIRNVYVRATKATARELRSIEKSVWMERNRRRSKGLPAGQSRPSC